MQTEHSITSIQEQLGTLLAQYPIELAYLYGSTAAGNVTRFSDIDIALVVTDGAIKPLERLRFELMIEDKLAELCSINNADVRVINDAPLALRGQVITEGILVYARDNLFRIDFETRTRLDFFDFQPILNTLRNEFFHSILTKGIDGKRTKNRRDVAQSPDLPAISV